MRGLLLINCTEAHVPSVRYGQYLMHALKHITRAVTTMETAGLPLLGLVSLA